MHMQTQQVWRIFMKNEKYKCLKFHCPQALLPFTIRQTIILQMHNSFKDNQTLTSIWLKLHGHQEANQHCIMGILPLPEPSLALASDDWDERFYFLFYTAYLYTVHL